MQCCISSVVSKMRGRILHISLLMVQLLSFEIVGEPNRLSSTDFKSKSAYKLQFIFTIGSLNAIDIAEIYIKLALENKAIL